MITRQRRCARDPIKRPKRDHVSKFWASIEIFFACGPYSVYRGLQLPGLVLASVSRPRWFLCGGAFPVPEA
jgi:hypothetical protein